MDEVAFARYFGNSDDRQGIHTAGMAILHRILLPVMI
jgi:hypothetical protein